MCDECTNGEHVVNSQGYASIDKPRIEAAVREFLAAIGEDPDREGLLGTPDRVARACEEIFGGMQEDPSLHLLRGLRIILSIHAGGCLDENKETVALAHFETIGHGIDICAVNVDTEP